MTTTMKTTRVGRPHGAKTTLPVSTDVFVLISRVDQALATVRHRTNGRRGYSDGLPDHAARRRIRVRAGLTQADLAMVIGVRRERLATWERVANPCTRELANAYATVLEHLGKTKRERVQ